MQYGKGGTDYYAKPVSYTHLGDLDETLIADLIHQGARIDNWGVGTKLDVYKRQAIAGL